MSNQIFPANLGGYTWDGTKKPTFNNLTHSVKNGRDLSLSLYSQPIYEFHLINNWLTSTDKATLINFFIERGGAFDSFLYTDEDSAVNNQAFATGNGADTAFQLIKTTNFASETVNNPASAPHIYLDGVLKTAGTHYTINDSGLVIMATAPALNAVLSWSGLAYYRCIFIEDNMEYNQFANRLYNCDTIDFKGSMANKL
jgi:hypothetical protein